MNYHIMIDDKFIDKFINESESVSENNLNRYFIRGIKSEAKYVTNSKVEWITDLWSDEFKSILYAIKEKDKIFVHWYDLYVGKLLLTINKNIPIYVAYWGGDFSEDPFLYNINWVHDPLTLQYVRKEYFSIKRWVKNPLRILKQIENRIFYKWIAKNRFKLKRLTVRRINYLLSDPYCAEYEKIVHDYGSLDMKNLTFFYDQNFDIAKNLTPTENKLSKTINVQIGNSATESCNHVDCIEVLKKFKEDNINLVFPLSYGVQKYAEFVKDFANRSFKNQCEFIEKFVQREAYIEKLNSVDIAIMFHNRSQAFGNCIALLTLGKKLYIKSNNSLWNFFKRSGMIVFDATEIENMSFEDFSRPLSQKQIEINITIISSLLSTEKRREYLKNILL